MRRYNFTSLVASLLSSLILAFLIGLFQPSPAAAQSPNNNVIYLNQAWSQNDREWYWHFSQGSAVLAYDIFLNLEVAGGQDLFRSDANSVLKELGLSIFRRINGRKHLLGPPITNHHTLF